MGIILYHIGHYGYFLRYLLHKSLYHQFDFAYFFIEVHGLDENAIEFLKKKSIDLSNQSINLIFYDEDEFRLSGQNSLDDLNKFFNKLLSDCELELDSVDEFHSGYDWRKFFTVYLLNNNKKIYLWDLASGTSTDINKLISPKMNILYKGISYSHPGVIKVFSNDPFHSSGDKNQYFDILAELKKLNPKSVRFYLSFFEMPPIPIGDYTVIALESTYGIGKCVGDVEWLTSYIYLAEYCNIPLDNVLIKPHPKSTLNECAVKSAFPNYIFIPGYVPIELLQIVPKIKLMNLLTLTNTIKLNVVHRVEFNLSLKGIFEYVPIFFAINKICENIGCKPEIKFSGFTKLVGNQLLNVFNKKKYSTLIGIYDSFNLKIASMGKTNEIVLNPENFLLLPQLLKYYTLVEIEVFGYYCHKYQILLKNDCKFDPCTYNFTNNTLTIRQKSINVLYKGLEYDGLNVTLQYYILNQIQNKRPYSHVQDLIVMLSPNIKTKTLLGIFDILWKQGNPADNSLLKSILDPLIDNDNCDAILRLARMYFHGRGVERDVCKSSELMLIAVSKGSRRAKWEYLDILRAINTPKTDCQAFEFASANSFEGKEIEMRIGRMYHEGRGVDKNLIKAAELMRKSLKYNISWAANEFLDILWEIGTEESCKEMVESAMCLANKENGGAMRRLGRAYWMGIGIEKNLDLAESWMIKAVNMNIKLAEKELVEIQAEKSSLSNNL